MERLTKDTPQGSFETLMNFVFSRDGWAHIRYDGEREDVPLGEWARRECCRLGCELVPDDDPEAVDERICDCMQDYPDCIVAMAYLFASQASHLRDRLKAIEDILGDEYDLDHLRELNQADKSGRLVVLAVSPYLQPVLRNEMYICEDGEAYPIYVTGVEIGPNNNGEMVDLYETLDGDTFLGSDIGKTVFLTRQGAEEALREEEG